MPTDLSDMNFAYGLAAQGDADVASDDALQANKRAEEYRQANERLQMTITMLRTQIEGLKAENARLQAQADVDAAHAAGLVAEKDALIREADKCPERPNHHPLVEKKEYVNGVTGKGEVGRASREIYRAAFDAEATARGLEDVEHLRR